MLCCFFRAGELLPTNSTGPFRCITWGDAAVDDAVHPKVLKIHLRVSKCDQFGKGEDVYISKLQSSRCPVTAVIEFMMARGDKPGPFFLTYEGSPLMKQKFVAEVRSALDVLGYNQSVFAGHSFHSGAVTELWILALRTACTKRPVIYS